MKVYVGIDLHSSSSFLGVLDEEGKRVFRAKVPNDPGRILQALASFGDGIAGVAVESTYNWYWLVDALGDNGHDVHLANPAAIQKYQGLKNSDDSTDAFWLAEMLRLGILPEGYIYPTEDRPLRDLLRKRGHLVRLRTPLILSLENILARNLGYRVSVNEVKRLGKDTVSPLLEGNEDLALAGKTTKEAIDDLTRRIRAIEQHVEGKMRDKIAYRFLHTLPGVGLILALTIALETGPVERFSKVGNYASYCRKVSSRWTSNDKLKGRGNKKNGNRYLAWAFSEAAEFARRSNERARAFYQRKLQKTNRMVAHMALSHKLARAAYFIMRDQVPFEEEKLFG